MSFFGLKGTIAEVEPAFTAWLAGPPNISIFTNNSGYLTSWGPEVDPVFSGSAAFGISSGDISTWNAKQSAISFGTGVLTAIGQAINGAGGFPVLDAGGKVLVTNLPSALMEYKGAWDVVANTPILVDGTGDNGDVYRASTAGTRNLGSGNQTWAIGDFCIYNGSIWQHSPATDAVVSVFGRTSAVVAATNDYTWAQIDKTTSSLADLTTRSAGDLSTGTLDGDRLPALSTTKRGGVKETGTPSGNFLRDDDTWAAISVTPADISQDGTTRKPSADMDWNTKKLTNCPEVDAPTATDLSLKADAAQNIKMLLGTNGAKLSYPVANQYLFKPIAAAGALWRFSTNSATWGELRIEHGSYTADHYLSLSAAGTIQSVTGQMIISDDASGSFSLDSSGYQTKFICKGLYGVHLQFRDNTLTDDAWDPGIPSRFTSIAWPHLGRPHSTYLGTGGLYVGACDNKVETGTIYLGSVDTSDHHSSITGDSSGDLTLTPYTGRSVGLASTPLINVQSIKNVATVTTLTGVAGTAPCCQPDQGSSYKKVHVYLDGYTDNATPANNVYTFPTAFAKAPYLYGDVAAIAVCAVTTTTLTISGAVTITGNVFVEGH